MSRQPHISILRTLSLLVTLVLVLTACGDDISVIEIGESGRDTLSTEPCPEELLSSDSRSIQELLSSVHTWADAKAMSITVAPDMPFIDDRVSAALDIYQSEVPYIIHSIDGEPLIGTQIPNQAIAQRQVAAAVDEWLRVREGKLLLGFGEYQTFAVTAIGQDIRFIGSCFEALTNPKLAALEAYAESSGIKGDRTSLDLFLDWAADPSGELNEVASAMAGSHRPTPWVDQDPSIRIVDAGITPAVELAQLDRVVYLLGLSEPVPGGANSVICPRTSVGWSPCISLGIWDNGNSLIAEVYGRAGDEVEFWILDDPPNVSTPIRELGRTNLEVDSVIHVNVRSGATDEILRGRTGSEFVNIARVSG